MFPENENVTRHSLIQSEVVLRFASFYYYENSESCILSLRSYPVSNCRFIIYAVYRIRVRKIRFSLRVLQFGSRCLRTIMIIFIACTRSEKILGTKITIIRNIIINHYLSEPSIESTTSYQFRDNCVKSLLLFNLCERGTVFRTRLVVK